ncbi:MAG: hypothetical protein ACYC6Q_04650 [Syntrophales bacterium]
MKRTILTLCVFFALSSLAYAQAFIECYDTTTGKAIFTNNRPPGAICEGDPGPELTPEERQQNARVRQRIDKEQPQIEAEREARDIDRRTDEANARIDAAIDSIKNNKANYYKDGGLRPRATDQIIDLEKSRLRDTRSDARIGDLINSIKNNPSNSYKDGGLRPGATQQIVDLEKVRLRLQENPQDAGLKMRNQQDDIETNMRRQQREMKAKTDAMNAEMSRQKREIQHLEYEKRMSEHNQRMQQLNK